MTKPTSRAGLARGEAVDPDTTTRLDVLDVGFDAQGAFVDVQAVTDGFFGCPPALVVVRRTNGEVWTARSVSPEGFTIFGFKSGMVPCKAIVRLRLQGGSKSSSAIFEIYRDVTRPAAAEEMEPTASSPALNLGDLAGQVERQQQGTIGAKVRSAVRPVIGGALVLGGLFVAIDNRKAIKSFLTGDE